MGLLEDIGICNQSGCEAIAIDAGDAFTIISRPRLFADYDMQAFAIRDPQRFKSGMSSVLTSTADINQLQWLAETIDNKIDRTFGRDGLIDFFVRHLGREIVAFTVPKFNANRESFLAEAERPLRIRNASVTEERDIDASRSMFQLTFECLDDAWRARLRDYMQPSSIILMSGVFVTVAALGSTPPFNGIIAATMWVVIGWQVITVGRMLGEAVAAFTVGDRRTCARKLADIIIIAGEALMFFFLGLAARFVRPAAARLTGRSAGQPPALGAGSGSGSGPGGTGRPPGGGSGGGSGPGRGSTPPPEEPTLVGQATLRTTRAEMASMVDDVLESYPFLKRLKAFAESRPDVARIRALLDEFCQLTGKRWVEVETTGMVDNPASWNTSANPGVLAIERRLFNDKAKLLHEVVHEIVAHFVVNSGQWRSLSYYSRNIGANWYLNQWVDWVIMGGVVPG